MSSWFSKPSPLQNAHVVLTAVISGAVVAGAIFGVQHLRRQYQIDDLKRSIPEVNQSHRVDRLTVYGGAVASGAVDQDDERSIALAARAQRGDYDEDLIKEQLARNYAFLTEEGMSRLRSAFVIIVGCGGVGSHAASALARSGVSRIRLIDFDQVSLSSLNRHAVATLADVGTPKVHCLRRRLEQVTPWAHFDCCNQLFSRVVAEVLLGPWEGHSPDYVVDAIDNIDTKVELMAYCHSQSLPIISSMGTGCKSDPSQIFIGDISTSLEDRLSRSTRRQLRALGIDRGIPVVYSTEKPGPRKARILPLPDEEHTKGDVGELSILPDFRVRILPVIGTMPAVFGYAIANHVILDLTGYPHDYIVAKNRDKLYDGILAALQGLEERLANKLSGGAPTANGAGHDGVDPAAVAPRRSIGLKLPVTKADVGFLVDEVFRGKSVVSGMATRLALIRWRRPVPSAKGLTTGKSTDDSKKKSRMIDDSIPNQVCSILPLTDLVCMTKEEASAHERVVLNEGRSPEDIYDGNVVRLVQRRSLEIEEWEKWR